MNSPVRDPILKAMLKAAETAGVLVMEHFNSLGALDISEKMSHQDLVTNVDTASQKLIVDTLYRELEAAGIRKSEIGFIGEEQLARSGKYVFVIDPIDGTTNFVSKIGNFAICIGCFIDGAISYGVVHDPVSRTNYVSKKGAGAYKTKENGGYKLDMSARPLRECLLATYLHTKEEQRLQEMDFVRGIFPHIKGVRVLGSGSMDLMRLADNAIQLIMYAKSKIWDIAAAGLIVRESRGMLFNLDGSGLQYDLSNPEKEYPLIACRKELLDEVLPFVRTSAT